MRFFLLFLVCIFGVVLLACQADGQETQGPSQDPKTPAAEKPDDTPQGSVKQSPLKTYYLRRKDGSLVPYFTIPFEEFDEMYKLYQGISAPDRPPRFILRDISITGFVKDDLATLNCSFQIFTKADGWVRVPIGMNELVLRESSTKSPATQFIMEFDKGGDGYVCRIQGKQNQKHTVKLTMLAKVQKAGDRRQFSFAIAHSSESNFELTVPEAKIDSLFEGRGVDDVQAIANGKSKLIVIGLGGEVRIAWRPKTESVAKARAFLQVASEVLVTVDRQRIVYQAEFQVESFRTPFDSFLVRVPRDLKVNELADDQRGYRIKVLAQDDPRFAKHARKSQLVEVLLNQTTTSTERILLVGERARGGNPNSPITISGFEVLDAILHSGEFNLSVVQPDSTVHWELPPELTPLESIPDRLRRSNVLARFAFYGADPWTLRVTVAEKTKTLRIEPTYFFLIQPDRVVLSAELKCRLAGASVKNLEVHLPGWTINDVGPSQWVQTDAVIREQLTPLRIALTSTAQSSTEEFVVRLQASRPVDGAESSLSIPIPRVIETSGTKPTIIVASAENISLTPDPDKMPELTSISFPASLTLPANWPVNRQGQATYQLHGNINSAAFVGLLSRVQQKVSGLVSGTVRLLPKRAIIEQELLLTVENEPMRGVVLSVPEQVVKQGELTVFLGDEKLNWTESTSSENDPKSNRRLIHVDLVEDRLGKVALTARFEQPLPAFTLEEPVPVEIAVITPVGMELRFGDIRFPSSRFQIEAREGWHVTNLQSEQVLKLENADAQPESIALTITRLEQPAVRTVVVRKLWVQSSLSKTGRQDRVAIQAVTREAQIEVRLAPGALIDDIALDGQRITEHVVHNQDRLTIPLATDGKQHEYVIELWYSFDNGRLPRGKISLAAPQVIGSRWTRRMYWQLVLPSDEHLLTGPKQMTPELSWSWQGIYWGRRATLAQRNLENWIGASRQSDVPASTNQYLFSTFGSTREIEIQTIARRTILLAIPLAVFLLGILLLYVRVVRHPIALLALGLIIAAVGLLYPEPALQVAQVAGIGLIFVLAMGVLKWLFSRPRRRPAAIHGTSVSHVDVGTTHVRIPVSSSDSQSTKSTSGLSVHLSESESKA